MNPIPPHLTHVTAELCPDIVMTILRMLASHILTVQSFELDANLAVTIRKCKGSHDRPVIHFVCPLIASPYGFPVFGSHKRIVLSILPVEMNFASGDHATHKTQLVCPLKVNIEVSVSQSHIRAVVSPLPETIRDDDSGENCVARMASPCPGRAAEQRATARTRKIACGV